MDLMDLVQEYLTLQQRKVEEQLEARYGVPPEEVQELASSYLKETFGPAVEMAEEICRTSGEMILFIGKEDCPLCRENLPKLQCFIDAHRDMTLLRLDYSQPAGLLYHFINQEDQGLLPMIAFIEGCQIRRVFTGRGLDIRTMEEVREEAGEKSCSQGICTVRKPVIKHTQLISREGLNQSHLLNRDEPINLN